MRIPFLCFLAHIVLFSSCGKDNSDPGNTPKATKDILMASQWKKSAYKENGVTTQFYASCEMDDILSFLANGNYTLVDGAVTCSSTTSSTDFYYIEADNKTMRWGLYGAGEISFNSSNTSFTFKRTGANTFEYIFVKN